MVGEIALAFTLLAVSAVLIGDVNALQRTWPGFDTRNVLTFQLTLSDAIAVKEETRVGHQIRLVEALAAVPGVEAVGFTNQTPLNGCCLSTALYPDGNAIDLAAPQKVAFLPASPGYFQAVGLTLRKGRLLTYTDSHDDVLTVVINEAAARHYWGSRDPVGTFGRISRPDGDRFRVIRAGSRRLPRSASPLGPSRETTTTSSHSKTGGSRWQWPTSPGRAWPQR